MGNLKLIDKNTKDLMKKSKRYDGIIFICSKFINYTLLNLTDKEVVANQIIPDNKKEQYDPCSVRNTNSQSSHV
ncbi:unnamed protein product [Rhizophagus irregularis]|nr:unnamed protein product [Rhizophagus irregularis]